MLSAAKHLLFLVENKQKQILRSAQDYSVGGFFQAACLLRDPPGASGCYNRQPWPQYWNRSKPRLS